MTMIGSFSECDRFSRKAGATMVCHCTCIYYRILRYDRIFRIRILFMRVFHNDEMDEMIGSFGAFSENVIGFPRKSPGVDEDKGKIT